MSEASDIHIIVLLALFYIHRCGNGSHDGEWQKEEEEDRKIEEAERKTAELNAAVTEEKTKKSAK